MNYDEFVGQVQNRARLDSSGAAVKAIPQEVANDGQMRSLWEPI